MAKIIKPELFSKRFNISSTKLNAAGLIDPILNCDTKLFIDPLLISTSSNQAIKLGAHQLMVQQFRNIIGLIDASKAVDDKAWRTAAKLLSLEERPETCLGYGGSGTSGSSRPETLRQKILLTTKEVIELGEKNPEIISLMGLFEDGVGPDTISDLTTNILLPVLCQITQAFCIAEGVPVRTFPKFPNFLLPANPYSKNRPVVLVPQDIVRHLPLAADWDDLDRVVQEIDGIRQAFNSYVGNIAESTIVDKKNALRKAALESIENFRALLAAILNSSDHYDPNKDIFNYYTLRRILATDHAAFSGKIEPPKAQTAAELKRIVRDIIVHFRGLVEVNNMWELLWDGERPKRERAAQLLFFAVADMFCKCNDVDISPETNMGGGPVDFKFSSGYAARMLVEIKLSKGQVIHGYKKQLDIYKNASKTEFGVLLVMDVGGLGKKLGQIKQIRDYRLQKGEMASDIELVDAKKRPSASKA